MRLIKKEPPRARVKLTAVLGKELNPGDLFTTYGPGYWSRCLDKGSIGEAVYIRTNIPSDQAPDPDEKVYRLEIITEPEEDG